MADTCTHCGLGELHRARTDCLQALIQKLLRTKNALRKEKRDHMALRVANRLMEAEENNEFSAKFSCQENFRAMPGQANFNITRPPNSVNISVYNNGLLLCHNTEWIQSGPGVITLCTPARGGDQITVLAM